MFGNSNLYNPNYSGFNRGQLYTGNSNMSATPGVLKKTYVEVRPKLNIMVKMKLFIRVMKVFIIIKRTMIIFF